MEKLKIVIGIKDRQRGEVFINFAITCLIGLSIGSVFALFV